MKPDELRQQITDQIVDALKQGETPFWVRPWSDDPNCGSPVNLATQKGYRGINPLLLMWAGIKNKLTSRYWASYQQWKSMGGQVRKGSKGTTVVFYRVFEKEARQSDDAADRFFVLRHYTLFNLDQVDGEHLDKYRPGSAVDGTAECVRDQWVVRADDAITATKAVIHYGGNKAYYDPSGDTIQIPHRTQFKELSEWYSTHFHELGHWACPRLDIKCEYAMGELIAELTSAFVSWQLDIPQGQDLANVKAYLASWLRAMEDDQKWILKAAASASRAADLILSFSAAGGKEAETEREPESADAA